MSRCDYFFGPREDHGVLQTHPELENERSYLNYAYERLETIKTTLRETLKEAYELERGGTPQSRAERDMIVRSTLDRLERLEFGALALCFGRIDLIAGNDSGADKFYIGRLAIADSDMEPLVVDWRAPIAEPFYRATALMPMGIQLRRHFESKDRVLIAIEDEPLDIEASKSNRGNLAGAGALFYAMDRARTGQMGDIVATIQREQDDIIRAPLPGVVVVQGGPGTGKTAVALHRAAYLLYTYRNRLESQGVLVVAPNFKFARYIERVLPSLGETGVEISTLGSLVEVKEPVTQPSDEEARLKADQRMVSFVAKAVRDRQRALPRDFGFYLGSVQLWVTPEMSRKSVLIAKRKPGTHNERRRTIESFLSTQLAKLYVSQSQKQLEFNHELVSRTDDHENIFGEPSGDIFIESVDPTETDEDVLKEVASTIRSEVEFQRIVGRIWPKLTPEQLLSDLFSHEALCRLAGKEILESYEVELLLKTFQKGSFSRSDLPLIDEARVELGPVSKKKPTDEIRKFGHIVVDEAQELSFMESRMLSRRSISSSMTLVGDLAQTTSSHGIRNWEKIVAPLANAVSAWEYRELSVNYRMPTEIAELAYRLLDLSELGLEKSVSIRSSGFSPVFIEAKKSILKELPAIVREELVVLGQGLIGVILANHVDVDAARTELLQVPATDSRVEVLNFEDAKGLEFDSVVVVQPTALVSDFASQKSALFTAMTRATKRLTLLYEHGELANLAAFDLM